MARRRFSREVDSAIAMAAERYRMDPATLRAIAKVESSGNPRAQTGSYSGLFMLSRGEFQRGSGGSRGDIYDPVANAMAAAANFRSFQDQFEKKFQRAPSPTELYMIHQQGWGGFQAHMANPDRPAWENMASTREGRARGEEWSRRAIRGNTLPDARQYGDAITSRQLMDSWGTRLSREPGLTLDTTASAAPVDPEARAFAGGTPLPLNQDEATAYAERPDVDPANAVYANSPGPTEVPNTRTSSIVQGVNAPTEGLNIGNLFDRPIFGSVPGAKNIGAGLTAAGAALSNSRVTLPQSPGPEAQMAELDRGAQQPVTIQPRKPRKAPGMGRGGAA